MTFPQWKASRRSTDRGATPFHRRFKVKEIKRITREAYIQSVERIVLQYQCKDFNKWHHYTKMLQKVDPYNPLLKVGFHGLPYTGGFKD